MHIAQKEFQILDEVDIPRSKEEEEPASKAYFPVEKIQKRSIRVEDRDVDDGEAPASTSRGPRAFKVNESLHKVMRSECRSPEKTQFLS